MKYKYTTVFTGQCIEICSTDLASIYEPIATGIKKMIPKVRIEEVGPPEFHYR